MQNQMKQLAYLLKAIGTVTVESLPELVELVPVYGPLLSKILEKVLAATGEYTDEKAGADIQEQINLLNEAIQQNTITETTVREEMQREIEKYLKDTQQRLPAYMFGIVLYPFLGYRIDKKNIKAIDGLLSQKFQYNSKEQQEYADDIHKFCYDYNGGTLFRRDDDYYISSEALTINFCTEVGLYRRDDEKIIDFIENLNGFLDEDVFMEYIVF